MKLVRYDAARHALQEARRVDEAKEIRDQAEALRVYARQRGDVEMERWVAEIKLRATVRIGELSRELEKAEGAREPGTNRGRLPSAGKTSKADALKAAGISKTAANRAEQLVADGPRQAAVERYIDEQVAAGKCCHVDEALRRAAKAGKQAARQKREAVRVEIARGKALPLRVAVGDVTSGLPDVKSESLDAIVTDPPYGEKHVPLYGALARFAARTLKPGGHCLVMTGQAHLPAIIRELEAELTYWWTIAYYTPGSSVQVFGRKVKSNWKPVLWFCKERIGKEQEQQTDVVHSESEDAASKTLHEWGQTVSGMLALIRRFTSAGALVADPFCGSGTTGVACILEGRGFLGFDIDAKAVADAVTRLKAPRAA